MKSAKTNISLFSLCLAFSLTVPAVCGHAQPQHNSEPQEIIHFVMNHLEGSGFVANDNGHGPSRYGILGRANGLSFQEVKGLSHNQATLIYKKNYWDAIDADHLPNKTRLIAFNAAVQFGPQKANKMIAAAHKDPMAIHEASSAFYENLVARNPARHSHWLKAWNYRQAVLRKYLDNYALLGDNALIAATHVMPQDVSSEIDEQPLAKEFSFSAKMDRHALDQTPPLQWIGTGFGLSSFALVLAGTLFYNRRRRAFRKLSDRNTVTTIRSSGKLALNTATSQTNKPASRNAFIGFSDAEIGAFFDVYYYRRSTKWEMGNQWRVNYNNQSNALIQNGCITLYEDAGIEDALKYAACAWNNKCVLTGGSKEFTRKVLIAAQKLVDEGAISSGFTIGGFGAFQRKNSSAPQTSTSRSSPQNKWHNALQLG